MSATAWVLAIDFAATHPAAAPTLLPVLLTMLALVELVGPLLLLYALRYAGELDPPTQATQAPAPLPPKGSS